MKGMVINTPSRLNNIFIRAIFIATLVLNTSMIIVNKWVNGWRNIIKKIVVIILKKIEKWASFLLSLLEENSVNNASKLVPMFAPKTKGIASYTFIALLIASIWSKAINRLDDCSAAVSKMPIIRLIKKLLVAFLI